MAGKEESADTELEKKEEQGVVERTSHELEVVGLMCRELPVALAAISSGSHPETYHRPEVPSGPLPFRDNFATGMCLVGAWGGGGGGQAPQSCAVDIDGVARQSCEEVSHAVASHLYGGGGCLGHSSLCRRRVKI